MFELMARDLDRCGDGWFRRVQELLTNPGMWAVVGYRYRRWAYKLPVVLPVRWLLRISIVVADVWIKIITNIELPVTAEIGPGLYIPHTGYVIVSSRTRIGSHCTLTQGVTIGHGGGGRRATTTSPVIGDRVYVGPSSCVVGPIEIGHDVLIGVGAVVINSVPPGGIVVGNPARTISRRGSFDLISYPGMDADSARLAALAELRSPDRCALDSAQAIGV